MTHSRAQDPTLADSAGVDIDQYQQSSPYDSNTTEDLDQLDQNFAQNDNLEQQSNSAEILAEPQNNTIPLGLQGTTPLTSGQLNAQQEAARQSLMSQYSGGKLQVFIDSISPAQGPMTGGTRVIVRGGPFANMTLLYPKPICKFGSRAKLVPATYVTCTSKILDVTDIEGGKANRDNYCIQCGASPPSDEEGFVPLSISLTGDFTDSQESQSFMYYANPTIKSIFPRYGVKDGQTKVEIWGDNFKNFDQSTRCAFGSKTVQAHFINSNYIICYSPPSDVVDKPIGLSISLNNQQNTRENINYWYYNQAIVSELTPGWGPDTGGNTILLKGSNFAPFNLTSDIDNSNDTFCYFEQLDQYTPLTVLNSSYASCPAALNNMGIDMTYVEVVLNSDKNRDITDDNVPYFYYKPPRITDIEPREGPTRGKTVVLVYGQDFKFGKTIICNFGDRKTKGKFNTLTEIECVSPPVPSPGFVKLYITYLGDGQNFQSSSVNYLYYETPVIYSVNPPCGPQSGFTQVTLTGKNFLDMGFGRVKCIFNGTRTNATIIDNTTLKCDSPPLTDDQRTLISRSDLSSLVQVTLNGRETTTERVFFYYYPELVLNGVSPNHGPLSGKTESLLDIEGYDHPNVCNLKFRYGAIDASYVIKNNKVYTTSPQVAVPDSVTISPSGNGLDFAPDITIHFRDEENTFTYLQDVFVTSFSPIMGPSSGGTKIVVNGQGFQQVKFENGTIRDVDTWVRLVDSLGNVTMAPKLIADLSETRFSFKSPSALAGTKATIQFSQNGVQWQNIIPETGSSQFSFYEAPTLTSIQPRFGAVKQPNQTAIITGTNFACDQSDPSCAKLVVRFGPEDYGTLHPGSLISNNQIKVTVPQYVKPEVMPVEISFNGEDFTNSNLTYNFFDPFLLSVVPPIVPTQKSVSLTLKGFGFVQIDNQNIQIKFTTADNGELSCNGQTPCIVPGTFVDQNTVNVNSIALGLLTYKNGTAVSISQEVVVELSVLDKYFTNEKIAIKYYVEPTFREISQATFPRNLQFPILIATEFHPEQNGNMASLNTNFTARFTVGNETVITLCRMETVPLGSQYSAANGASQPTHLACQSPQMNNHGVGTIAFSANGQDYSGSMPYESTELLDLFRILPRCGPVDGKNTIKLIGSGFKSSQDQVLAKFGVSTSVSIVKDQVKQETWSESNWFKSQLVTQGDFQKYQHREHKLNENDVVSTTLLTVPSSASSGPVYVSVGQQKSQNTSSGEEQTYHFSNSMVEYYYYKQPVVVKVEPTSGLVSGGTPLQISGAWFDYKIEYGVIPYCKLGDKIIRGTFQSTVRIICTTPPSDNTYQQLPIKVSLNGVDFVDTDFTYNYYQQSNIFSLTPITGRANTGTEVYLVGEKFSNITLEQNTNCKWTLIDNLDVELQRDNFVQFTPAIYVNETMMQCNAPGSFIGGDRAYVQLTFNNIDYSDVSDKLIFTFFQTGDPFPHSGPADALNDMIIIKGAGIKPTSLVFCELNNTRVPAIEVTSTSIKCPMALPNKNPLTTGAVNFAMIIDGARTDFQDFYYYPQVELYDIQPRNGPAEGKGIIFFFGSKFRDDFPQAQLGCKVGTSVGKGVRIDDGTIRCIVESIELVNEGESLPVFVALNSYSWVGAKTISRRLNSEFIGYVPYGVLTLEPDSGPFEGFTDIFVTGKGFVSELAEKAKCRFGAAENFVEVSAEVLDYTKMVCRSPAGDFVSGGVKNGTAAVPFGISLGQEEFQPWTQDFHKFRYYVPAVLERASPDEVEIGKKQEIYIFAQADKPFYQPIATGTLGKPDYQGPSSVKCAFGKFGSSLGMYINSTTVLCLSPTISDRPEDFATETVFVGVAMNGQDFETETSSVQVTFVGTGDSSAIWHFLASLLLFSLMILGIIMLCIGLYNYCQRVPGLRGQSAVITVRSIDGTLPRGYNKGQGMAGLSDSRMSRGSSIRP